MAVRPAVGVGAVVGIGRVLAGRPCPASSWLLAMAVLPRCLLAVPRLAVLRLFVARLFVARLTVTPLAVRRLFVALLAVSLLPVALLAVTLLVRSLLPGLAVTLLLRLAGLAGLAGPLLSLLGVSRRDVDLPGVGIRRAGLGLGLLTRLGVPLARLAVGLQTRLLPVAGRGAGLLRLRLPLAVPLRLLPPPLRRLGLRLLPLSLLPCACWPCACWPWLGS